MTAMARILSAAALLLVVLPARGLKCYSCTTIEEKSACVENPGSVTNGIKTCDTNVKYCINTRVHMAGVFSSLSRDCGTPNLPDTLLNRTVTTGNVVTFHTACDSDTCNQGDGVIVRQCYSCTTADEKSHCVVAPDKLEKGLVDCSPGVEYCVNSRQETAGAFTSMTRSCGIPNLSQEFLNRTATAGAMKIHHTACDSDGCNTGDGVIGIECYSCSSDNEDCIDNLEEVPNWIVGCEGDVKYCVITRLDTDGKLTSLKRGCGAPNLAESLINTSVIDGKTKTHNTACDSNECNKGNGVILKCFACTSPDASCDESPDKVQDGVRDCAEKYCGIIRSEKYLYGRLDSWSLNRTCLGEDYAFVASKTVVSLSEDGSERTAKHYTLCEDDQCNEGDGVAVAVCGAAEAGPAALGLLAAAVVALLGGRAGN